MSSSDSPPRRQVDAFFSLDGSFLPSNSILIGFLRSYEETMGLLVVECTGGCRCNRSHIPGWHEHRTSIFRMELVNVERQRGGGGGCKLSLTHTTRPLRTRIHGTAGARISSASMANSSATCYETSKFKLLALIQPPSELNMRAQMKLLTNGLGGGSGGGTTGWS